MVQAHRRALWGIDEPYSICTSQAERKDLTLRTFLRRSTGLSLEFTMKLENLCAGVVRLVSPNRFIRRYGDRPVAASKMFCEGWKMQRLTGQGARCYSD